MWVETPTNPLLKLADIKAISDIAHSQDGVRVVVDNTFASPYFQVSISAILQAEWTIPVPVTAVGIMFDHRTVLQYLLCAYVTPLIKVCGNILANLNDLTSALRSITCHKFLSVTSLCLLLDHQSQQDVDQKAELMLFLKACSECCRLSIQKFP